jgi:hypothetical protein
MITVPGPTDDRLLQILSQFARFMPVPEDHPSNIYREQLSSLYHGYALWEPSPIKNYYDRVSVGDVGYIEEGFFHRMFNVILDWDDASNKKLCIPEYYKPLADSSNNIRESPFPKGEYFSRHISSEDNTDYIGAKKPSE